MGTAVHDECLQQLRVHDAKWEAKISQKNTQIDLIWTMLEADSRNIFKEVAFEL